MYEGLFLLLGVVLVISAYLRFPRPLLAIASAIAAIPFASYVFDRTLFGEFSAFEAFVSLSVALAMFYAAFALKDAAPSSVSLIIASAIGALVAGMSHNRLRVLVGRELGSVPTYLLVAYERRYEPARRYAAIGIMGSIAMLLGLVLYVIKLKTLNFVPIINEPLAAVGALLILYGMLVKLPVFPIHGRLVDVFDEGYPKSLPRIAAGTKVVVFAALSYAIVKSLQLDRLLLFFALLVAITMTYANIAALYEDDLLRILAYSTIAHASYAAIGLIALTQQALVGTRIHILGTTAMKGGLLSFIVLAGIRKLEDLAGIARNKLIGIAFVASVLSLIGLPPFIGFRSKYRLILGAIGTKYRRLGVALVVNTVISIGYYSKLIAKALEAKETNVEDHKRLAIAILVVLFLSLYPQWLFEFASEAISAI